MQSMFSFNMAGNGQGMTGAPTISRDGYPFDLDGSLDFVRPAKGLAYYPDPATYPNKRGIGCVSGLMPQQDKFVWAQLIARIPAGPTVDHVPANPMQYIGQVTFPQLQQVGSMNQGAVSA